ncbi:MAG: RNA-binding S4 domain-containing protein [Bifidobacteriaceae bacterium]|jgi:ribosome-associated heat shock protein Hsp15|nr:RNA-binding S4 domain-containing protein [Bifidobacteriaceae bacterium]
MDKARIDSWMWAVRLFKSRSLAAAACKAGHVRVDGERAKPATLVGPGDEVHVRGPRERIVIVVKPLVKRVGAALAVEAYEDHSPAPAPIEKRTDLPIAVRDRGTGRPTKSERRQLDRLRGRPSH